MQTGAWRESSTTSACRRSTTNFSCPTTRKKLWRAFFPEARRAGGRVRGVRGGRARAVGGRRRVRRHLAFPVQVEGENGEQECVGREAEEPPPGDQAFDEQKGDVPHGKRKKDSQDRRKPQ